jgi:head-tail adaptor
MAKCCDDDPVAKMKHRVTIQNPVRASDSQGGFTETYPDGSTVWASIEPVKG